MMKRSAHRAAHDARHGAARGRTVPRDRSARQTRFTRVRAILAGALVLGVGSTLTLAAWTDTEYASGTFTASKFAVEGSVDNGTNYGDHASAGSAAALTFAPNALLMSPGITTYSKFLVRAVDGTSVDGTVLLGGSTAPGAGTLDPYLTYGVKEIPAGSACTAGTFSGTPYVVAPGQALTTGATVSQPILANRSPVAYCFAITLKPDAPNSAQGLSAAPKWTFTATSSS